MRRPVALVLAVVAAVLVLAGATAAGASAALPPGVAQLPVAFAVKNVNGSRAPCAADGATYTVRGHITGPAATLAAGSGLAGALYAHGLSYGEFFWRFEGTATDPVSGYDYAVEQARHGLVSITIDRLGYGASGKPPGKKVCLGSEADYLHQIVGELRAGTYDAGAGTPPRFARLALAGHSLGGYMAEDEAYSFGGIDALMLFGFADLPTGVPTYLDFVPTTLICAGPGQPPTGATSPLGYAYFGQTDADFQRAHLHDVDPTVARAVTALRTRDPCGDTGSALSTALVNALDLFRVKVPVLLVGGANDALFPPPAQQLQRLLFTGSKDVTQITLPDTGHAVTLGRTAPLFRSTVARWLCARGYGCG
jgi:pimeloyl-ACP methyl ester carboxylesterase